MCYIKFLLNLVLLFLSSLAFELDLREYMPIGGVVIGAVSFVLAIFFAFLVYEGLSGICGFSEDELRGNKKRIYQAICLISVLIITIGFFVKTEVSIIKALISSASLVLIILVMDFSKKLSRAVKMT